MHDTRLPSEVAGSRRVLALGAGVLAAIVLALCGAGAAQAESGLVAFPGSPLSVFIGQHGECQSSYPLTGVNYYLNEKGDCGFFLAFPKHPAKAPPHFLEEKVFGFQGSAGPHLSGEQEYVPISQTPVEGAGTAGSPYTETTVFDVAEAEENEAGLRTVKAGSEPFVKVTEVTTYISGAPQFASTFTVENLTKNTLFFRAIYAGDLYVAGNDFGTGSFLGGPPRFVGGLNTAEGILGGFIESTPWSSWQEGCWNNGVAEGTEGGRCSGDNAGDKGIWETVRQSASAGTESGSVFKQEVDPAQIDNAAAVEWDEALTKGLGAKEKQSFTIINHTEAPAGLAVTPASQTLTQGQTETVSVTALNTAGKPYAGGTIRYSVAGSNAQTGSITLNASGQGAISYVGNNAGADTIQMYLDVGNTGSQTPTDPSASATVTWLPKPPPPTPNSTYVVQSIKANSNGTITITFVPAQGGTATLEVTVPTGTISRRDAEAAKRHRCKKGQIKLKGKCRPANTVTGRVSATGVAGVPLTISIKPSGRIKSALKKGRTLHLTVTLSYRSALGGSPTVQTFHVTVKAPKHKKKK